MKPVSDTKKIALAGVFMALIFLFTYTLKVPVPATQGYVHLGDGFILLAPILLGPGLGVLVSAFGSALADYIGGYLVYLPATLVIKGLEALVLYLLYRLLVKNSQPLKQLLAYGLSSVVASLCMVLGYYLYEFVLYGSTAALAAVPSNLGQALASVVIALILFLPLQKALGKR